MAKGSICRNCFHSYVCEQFNDNKDDNNEKCHFLNDHYVPTENVVPKSEVDRLVDKWIGEENLTQDATVLRLIEALQDEAKRYERYYFNHEYDKLIAEAKQEVAREIFKRIRNKFDYFKRYREVNDIIDNFFTLVEEVENEYTESEDK